MIQEDCSHWIIDTVSYVNKFRGSTFLIKFGGSILHNETLIESLCSDLKLLRGAGIGVIIVHGGSQAINKYLSINNIKSEFVDGLRVTSVEAMKIIEMVLCGHVNTMLVRKLNRVGINAIGLSGADNNMLQCDYYSKEHGCVGTINSVNVDGVCHSLLQHAMQLGVTPVIAPVGVDAEGNPMNINADYAASHIATSLKVDKLIYMTDQDGIYDQDGKIYSELSSNDLLELIKNKTVEGGMLTKVKAILSALDGNLNHVHILNGNKKHVLVNELFTVDGIGTLCKKAQSFTHSLEAVA